MGEKGYLHSVLWIVLSAMLALMLLYFLPEISAGGWTMRKIDMLSDLRGQQGALGDTIESIKPIDNKYEIDSCRPGMTCIDDMSGAQGQGMEPLWAALDSIKQLGRPVRIAVLGDSYIEGDILTADLRQQLQQRFGGCGVGYLPITSEVAGFRQSVVQKWDGWTAHNGNDKNGYEPRWANLTGHYFFAGSGAWVSANGVRFMKGLDACQRSTVYCMGNGSVTVTADVNGATVAQRRIDLNGAVGQASVDGHIASVRWTVNSGSGSAAFLGLAMDPTSGIVVDNFSLRSASGFQLQNVSDKMLRDFDAARHYDLVVLMYGLNIANAGQRDYSHYANKMGAIIDRMKAAMPTTGFLVVGCSDRAERSGGSFRTIPAVLNLINAQQRMAYDRHVAFWNLYGAMGGEGSIARMVNARPSEANLDYTHINRRGGQRLARLLADALLWGYECHRVATGQITKSQMK